MARVAAAELSGCGLPRHFPSVKCTPDPSFPVFSLPMMCENKSEGFLDLAVAFCGRHQLAILACLLFVFVSVQHDRGGDDFRWEAFRSASFAAKVALVFAAGFLLEQAWLIWQMWIPARRLFRYPNSLQEFRVTGLIMRYAAPVAPSLVDSFLPLFLLGILLGWSASSASIVCLFCTLFITMVQWLLSVELLRCVLERVFTSFGRRTWYDSTTISISLAAVLPCILGAWVGHSVSHLMAAAIVLLGCIAIVELVAWIHLPPAIVLLGASTPENANLQYRLQRMCWPLRVVSLLNPESATGKARVFLKQFSLRQSSLVQWEEAVAQLIAISRVTIFDPRTRTSHVLKEARLIRRWGLTGKTLVRGSWESQHEFMTDGTSVHGAEAYIYVENEQWSPSQFCSTEEELDEKLEHLLARYHRIAMQYCRRPPWP